MYVVVRLDDLDKILVKGWSNFREHKLRRIGVTLELECMWEKVRFRLLAEEKAKHSFPTHLLDFQFLQVCP